MATSSYFKFNQFTKDLIDGVHDFDAHTFKVYLTNATPDAAADLVKADLTEISASGGYTAGGNTTSITTGTSSGVAKVTGGDPATWTGTGAGFGPFRYAVLYNDTATGDPLIAYWDYGSSISVGDTETFAVDFSASNGIFTVT